METDKARFMRILHCTIERFISSLNSYFSPEVLEIIDIQKVFCEIMKRSDPIIQQLRNITISVSAKTSLDEKEANIHGTNRLPELQKRIEDLVNNVFSQDLLEIALNGNESFSVTDVELHNMLFSGAMKDITSFTPSPVEMGGHCRPFSAFCESAPTFSEEATKPSFSNSLQLSSQFEDARIEFDDAFSQMKRIVESGYAISDLCDVASSSRNENNDTTAKMSLNQKLNQCEEYDECNYVLPLHRRSMVFDFDKVSDFLAEDLEDSDFLSWEDCLGRNFLYEHIYIPEIPPEDPRLIILKKEYHTYSSLVNPSEAVSEEVMIHDILDLLIGLPSDTFFYDIHSRKFRIKSGVHLPNLSSECTAVFTAKFIESGSMYYALQNFSRDFLHASQGSVFKGMQHGIHQILSVYNEYIAAVKVNSPTMLFMKTDVMKNADLLQSFGVICGIDPEKMIIKEIPKGLGLLSYLHNLARSQKIKEHGIMIAVLLKYAYAPYFSFLNEWMTEGICNDPYNEFQIVEDEKYLKRCDSLFWKFAYTEKRSSYREVVPPELRDFSQDILDCGKSIKLLKHLSPQLFSQTFFSPKPPPSLSMVYSFPAVIYKVVECMDYIILKEKDDSQPGLQISDVSVDRFYVESQKLVTKEQMLELVKRRYNIIVASNAAKSNVLNLKKVSHYLIEDAINSSDSPSKGDDLPVLITENKDIPKGGLFRNVGPLFSSSVKKSLHTHHSKILNFVPPCPKGRDDNFSGKLYDNIGLLFSSCGYVENDRKSDCLIRDTQCNFPSSDFSKQLCLPSYSHYSSLTADNICNKLPSNREFWSSFWHKSVIPNLKNIVTNLMRFHGISASEENFIQDMLSDQTITRILTTKEDVGTSGDKNKNSFVDKLATLLVSEYGDSIDDIYSCIQVTSLRRLMLHNFQSVLKTRMHVVEKAIMKCMVREYQLNSLLFGLRNIYFLQDEAFSQSLCESLFSLVMKCKTSREFANRTVLNEILVNAISDSDYKYNSFIFSLDANIGFLPSDSPIDKIDFLRLFVIDIKVKWPLNIVVHQACVHQYLRIFSILLEIEFVCWLLSRAWQHLIMISKELHLDDSPQFRVIMINRFDMDQLIRLIRNSIHQHLQGPLWGFLLQSLSAERSSIDNLEDIHMKYLEKVLTRCFLTDETDELRQILSAMLHQIYSICIAIFDCKWEKNEPTSNYKTCSFNKWVRAFQLYKHFQRKFLEGIMKEYRRKTSGCYCDTDYVDFLDAIVEAEKYSLMTRSVYGRM